MLDKVESARLLVGDEATDSDDYHDSATSSTPVISKKPRHRQIGSNIRHMSTKSIFYIHDEEARGPGLKRSIDRRMPGKWRLVLAALCGAIVGTTLLLALVRDHSQRGYLSRDLQHAKQTFSRPKFPVVAMVFCKLCTMAGIVSVTY